MPARKCLSCGRSFPATKGSKVKCPFCSDQILQFSSHATPDTDLPPEVADKLPPIDPEVEQEIAADWEWIAQRKRGGWSDADLIDAFPRKVA